MRIQPPDIEAMTRASLHEVYVLDAATLQLRYVSAGALRNLGYTRPRLREMTYLHLDPELTASSLRHVVAPVLDRSRRSLVFRTTHRRADGSLYPVDVSVRVIEPVRDRPLLLLLAVLAGVMERTQAAASLHGLLNYDRLTGLPNGTLLRDRLRQALALAKRDNHSLALLLLDLDRFKLLNDTLGHRAGDAVLTTVATRLADCLREGDTVARTGGDEFSIILTGCSSPRGVSLTAQRILDAVSQPIALDGQEVSPTASLGIALYPADGRDPETLLTRADLALGRARRAGGNSAQFYKADMTARAREDLDLEAGLRRAADHDELLLHYQPQVELTSSRIVGLEALARWRHPTLGVVPPSRFIPLAEETGLIVPLGRWVLRTACAQAKAWQVRGTTEFRIAVNVSARQFQQENVVRMVEETLRSTGLAPDCLELELTESALMDGAEATLATLSKLKALGVHLSIDDFGTGYSSLRYLALFPIDGLKIDQSFVRDLPGAPGAAAVTTSILALARTLGLKVIAEGVENHAQWRFLQQHGGRDGYAAQGYLCGRPLPAEQTERLVKR